MTRRSQPLGFFDRDDPILTTPRTTAERHAARLTAARNAKDADDLRHLLSVLGLWPRDDNQIEVGAPAPAPFVGGYQQRMHP